MNCDDFEATAANDDDPIKSSNYVELSQYIKKLRLVQDENSRVIEVSGKYVTKSYREEELQDTKQALEYAESLGIRVPAIRRIVRTADDVFECVQDRVDGVNLMDCWTSLGWVSTIRLAFQLRAMVRKMRKVTSPTAGSLGTGICRSFWIEDRYRLPISPSARAIACVINFWFNHTSFRQEARRKPEDHATSVAGPITAQPLVFTHHDLAPRNLILDTKGSIWPVDWDYAGWYPQYFEYAAMHNFIPPDTWSRFAKYRWNLFAWIATGLFERERKILVTAQRKALRFPAARRFNIKAGATPSLRTPDD
ncbi:hypothetical protein N8I77_010382 [Diaporthe amygdali]|uniref:Aminoglycoside phosphotransferase domain-containing protein n=1 Tax=Phomopsis amygdali TaxID=1214568 RepID=A0AAD9VZ91_PHOAM|nr:hypothetical protein N8I77_010382 [Diaporthe amygdali]